MVCFRSVAWDLLLLQFKYPDSGQSNTLLAAHSSALSEDKRAFGRTASSLNTSAWGMVAGKGLISHKSCLSQPKLCSGYIRKWFWVLTKTLSSLLSLQSMEKSLIFVLQAGVPGSPPCSEATSSGFSLRIPLIRPSLVSTKRDAEMDSICVPLLLQVPSTVVINADHWFYSHWPYGFTLTLGWRKWLLKEQSHGESGGSEVICCMPYCNVIKTKGIDSPSTARAKGIKESTQHVVLRHAGIILEGY